MADNQPAIELSERELQVLQLVVTGASNQEIARKLVISINTVKVHLRNIFTKLEVQSRTEATLRAIQEGLVIVNEPLAEPAEDENAAPVLRSYLIEVKPPLVLLPWQQAYLLGATLFALMIVVLPFLPKEKDKPAIPVIYEEAPAAPTSASNRWQSRAPMTNRRAGLAIVAFDQKIFAIGGARTHNRASRFVEIYDVAADTWTEGSSKPTATSDVAGAVLDGKIYVPGGCTDESKAVAVLEIYDIKRDEWTEGPALPEPRCGYGLSLFQGKLYLFGGWNGQAFEDTIFTFSPEEDKWQISEYTMPQALGYIGAAVISDTIYIVGGYNGEEEFDTTSAFVPASGAWQEKSPLNEKRGGLGLVSNDKQLYAIGGGWNQALSSNEKYDPATDTWTPFETPTLGSWRNPGLAIIDTTIYAIGGWDGAANEFTDRVVSYQFLFQFFLPVSINQGQPLNE